MEIKIGCLYHIKDEFFKLVDDKYLMLNHENGHSRPNYFVLKDNNFYWAIPLSSRVDKYKKIISRKKNKICTTIMFAQIGPHEGAILLQNAFPIIEEYIQKIHLINNKEVNMNEVLTNAILKNFKKMLHLKKNGINLFYPDVDRIKTILEKELVH